MRAMYSDWLAGSYLERWGEGRCDKPLTGIEWLMIFFPAVCMIRCKNMGPPAGDTFLSFHRSAICPWQDVPVLNGYEAWLCCSDVILMQSNPPLSLGCECMSGMRGPLKSFPLHCSVNRLVLCGEVIQLHCWVLLVCVCVSVFICVCFPLAWKEPSPVFQPELLYPALFICWISVPIGYSYYCKSPLQEVCQICVAALCIAPSLHASLQLSVGGDRAPACPIVRMRRKFCGQVCWHKDKIDSGSQELSLLLHS